jgi:eukaryotic-like serine/threonine-protein kinase
MPTVNPYLNRVAIRDCTQFFGRRKEVARIFSRIGASRPQSISVVGDRRIGKSSLLNYILTPEIQRQHLARPEEYVFVFFDLQQRRNLSLNNFLEEWLAEIRRVLGSDAPAAQGSFDGVRAILEFLRGAHRKLIAIFDEFDIITSNRAFSADFFAFLRSLANNYEVAYITSSGRDLQELCHTDQIADSPFFNIFTNVYLRQFTNDEVRELIVRPSALAGIPLEAYVDEIRRFGGNFPFYIQIACSNYFEQLQDGALDRGSIEALFDDEVRGHFRYLWEHFSEVEHAVCRAVADGQLPAKEQTHVLEDLKRAGYVIEENGMNRLFSHRFLAVATRPTRTTATTDEYLVTEIPVEEIEIPATDPALDPMHLSGDITRRMTQESMRKVPKKIGRFELQERIGGGGMGDVFLARDTELGRKVAIKLLKSRHAGDDETRRRFLREARTASSLNHPNIATVYEIGEIGDVPYLVMEYLKGRTISQRLRQEGRFPIADITRLGAQAAHALAEAHATGVVHRDVKSSNLMIDKHGNVKILDFGLAKFDVFARRNNESDESLPPYSDITEPGILVGTVTYMSPEQAANDSAASPASDIFSLGVVLYEMTTGRLPFDGKSYYQVIDAILHATPSPVRDLRPDAPDALVTVIARALAKNPADRFPSAEDMAAALREIH